MTTKCLSNISLVIIEFPENEKKAHFENFRSIKRTNTIKLILGNLEEILSQPECARLSVSADERKKRARMEKSARALPSPAPVFPAFFSIRCPQYLGAWYRLILPSSKVIVVDKEEIGMNEYASIKKNRR